MLPITRYRHSPVVSQSRGGRGLALTTLVAGLTCCLALTSCATNATPDPPSDSRTVTLIVHNSFPNDEFSKAASKATGYEVKVVSVGDGGELTNKLVLTRGAPVGDAFFGADNIFASRLIDNEVADPYTPADFPASAWQYSIDASASSSRSNSGAQLALVPVGTGATCINIDTEWFAAKGIAEPKTYLDLADPAYKDLTTLLDPTASSTGASFLVGTVATYGESGFAGYWKQLVDNGARVEQGWSEAYYGQFTQGGADGTRPIVVSYSSSPAFTANKAGTATTTKALLDTCSTQVEYAGVLAGAANPKGARAVLDYLVSREFQSTIPEAMYAYPVDDEVAIPDAWAKLAPLPERGQSHDLTAVEIDRGRESWLKTLSEEIGL
jgi:thiamine transport system substrate-binding protein